MPFVSVEWQCQGPRFGAALHALPCPAPFAHRTDQWWSLGCVAQEDGTALTMLSGPCAANGVRSSIKQRQGEFGPYDETYLAVPPHGIIEKTFYLQVYPVSREGSGFQTPTRTSLRIFEPLSLYGLPTCEDILRSKYRYSQTRWRDLGEVAGFRKFPDNGGPFFVIGWCGQAAAPGYALQVLGERLDAKDVDQQVLKSLNTISRAKFYEGGFHTWYDYEKNEWSHVELLSQGQGMNNMANAVRVGRQRKLDTSQWESFLCHASDVHAARFWTGSGLHSRRMKDSSLRRCVKPTVCLDSRRICKLRGKLPTRMEVDKYRCVNPIGAERSMPAARTRKVPMPRCKGSWRCTKRRKRIAICSGRSMPWTSCSPTSVSGTWTFRPADSEATRSPRAAGRPFRCRTCTWTPMAYS